MSTGATGATAPSVNAKPATGFFGMLFGSPAKPVNKNVEKLAAGAKHNAVNVKPANANATATPAVATTANQKLNNSQTAVTMGGGRRTKSKSKSKSKTGKSKKSKKVRRHK